jgi:predicted lipoprotein
MSLAERVMSRLAGVVVACLVAFGAASAAEHGAFDHAGLARQALEKHIQPGYAALVSAAAALTKSLDAYCARRTNEQQRSMERAFDGLVTAWGRIEHIRFGPITEDNRLERIFFWPDRRGIGARQVAQVIRAREADALDPDKLAKKRVAIQGLGALEIALFDASPIDADERAFRCAYAKAISANIGNLAAAVLADWTGASGYARDWLNPGDGNPHFLKASETTLALGKSLDNGLERVRDEWIGAAIGLNAQRRKLTPVLAKSKRTLKLFQAGMDGLHHLYTAGGLHKAILDTSPAHLGVTVPLNAKLVRNEIETARGEIAKLARQGKPFDADKMMQPLVAVGFPMKNAREQAIALLGLTAGLSMGFNASDGD